MSSPFLSDFLNEERAASPDEAILESLQFTRSQVQIILDQGQLGAGTTYPDAPHIRVPIQAAFRLALEECNNPSIDPMHILRKQMRVEWHTLDALFTHRLSQQLRQYLKNYAERGHFMDEGEVNEIPKLMIHFPLRKHIYQHAIEMLHTRSEPSSPLKKNVEQVDTPTPAMTAASVPGSVSSFSSITPSPRSTKKGRGNKKGRGAQNYDKLADAPTAQLDFPTGNITLAELLCFLPQCIKSWNVIDRSLHNGALTVTLAIMINHFRTMPNGEISNNTVYKMMKGTIDRRAEVEPEYKDWVVAKHATIKKPEGFDPTSISVTGFRTPVNYSKRNTVAGNSRPSPQILFRDLANGVKIMPSGYDALDLTRCVRHCVDNPDQDWYYPQDFEKLLSLIEQDRAFEGYPKGPAPVLVYHQDEAIVNRYTSYQKKQGAMKNFGRQRDSRGRLLKQDKEIESNEDNNTDIRLAGDEDHDTVLDVASKKRKRAIDTDVPSEEDASVPVQPAKRVALSPMPDSCSLASPAFGSLASPAFGSLASPAFGSLASSAFDSLALSAFDSLASPAFDSLASLAYDSFDSSAYDSFDSSAYDSFASSDAM